MFLRKATIAGALLTVLGFSAAASANEGGQVIFGVRIAPHYSYAADFEFNPNPVGTPYAPPAGSPYGDLPNRWYSNDGGFGFEGGLIARMAVVPGQLGLSGGLNYIYRTPVVSGPTNRTVRTIENVLSVPLIVEISPALAGLGGGDTGPYELIFLQLGIQIDRILSYREEIDGKEVDEEFHAFKKRSDDTDIGFVIGAVGYLSSNVSIDVRYVLGFNQYSGLRNTWLGQASLGLSIFF